jgi:hypothetical protein
LVGAKFRPPEFGEAGCQSFDKAHDHATKEKSEKLLTSAVTSRRRQKAKSPANRAFCLIYLGWLMGLEPTTTGITILDSTN